MESLEEHMEAAGERESNDEEDTTEDLEYTQAEVEDQEDGPPGNEEEDGDQDPTSVYLEETDDDSEDDETVTVGGVVYPVGNKRKRENDEALFNSDTIAMGGSVKIADLTWTRIEGLPEDSRTEPHLPTTFKTNLFHDGTREIDVF
jgi:hypothetical protein